VAEVQCPQLWGPDNLSLSSVNLTLNVHKEGEDHMSSRSAAKLLPLSLFVGVSMAAYPAHAVVTYGSTVNVSHDNADAGTRALAVNGSYVHVTWSEDATLFYSRSTDSGSTFGAASTLFTTSGQAGGYGSAAQVATSGSNVYVARSHRPKPKQSSQVFFRRSTNNGASFSAQVQVSNGTLSSNFEGMAVSGNNVYIVWSQSVPNWEVFLGRSNDGGATFFPPVNLTNTSANNSLNSARVVADGSRVHVVWTEEDPAGLKILFRSSGDSGANFGSSMQLSTSGTASFFPEIAADTLNVYVVFRAGDVYVNQSVDGGLSFGTPVDLSGPAVINGLLGVAATGLDVHVIWNEDQGGADNVKYTHSNNAGLSYSTPVNVSNSTVDVSGAVAVNGSNVYINWCDQLEVYSVHSGDGGNTLDTAINVSSSAGGSSAATPVATAAGVHQIWIDYTPGNGDVFYSKGTL